MSALNPKNDQEAKAMQENGVKAQLAQSTKAQERTVQDLKSDRHANKAEIEKQVQTLNCLQKEQELLEQNN